MKKHIPNADHHPKTSRAGARGQLPPWRPQATRYRPSGEPIGRVRAVVFSGEFITTRTEDGAGVMTAYNNCPGNKRVAGVSRSRDTNTCRDNTGRVSCFSVAV